MLPQKRTAPCSGSLRILMSTDDEDDEDANQHNEDGVSSECIKKAARVFNDKKHISELFLAV